MKWLPFESYVIETTNLVSDLVKRLQSHTERPHVIRFELSNSEFVGWVSENGFRIKPVIRTGASFVPELFGRFMSDQDGTRVFVEVIPSSAALAIIAAVAGAIGMMVFYSGPRVYVVIIGGLFLAWLFSIVGFWLEAGKSRPMLVEALCGRSADSLDNVETPTGVNEAQD